LDIIPPADDIRRELTKIKERMKSEFKHLDQTIIDTAVKKVESDLIRDLHGSTGDRKKLDKDPCVFPDSTHVQKTFKRRLKDVLKSFRHL